MACIPYLPSCIVPTAPHTGFATSTLAHLREKCSGSAAASSIEATLEYAGALWAEVRRTRREQENTSLQLFWSVEGGGGGGGGGRISSQGSLSVELILVLFRLCALYAKSAAEDGAGHTLRSLHCLLAARTIDLVLALYQRWYRQQGWPSALAEMTPTELHARSAILFCQSQELLAHRNATPLDDRVAILLAAAGRYAEVATAMPAAAALRNYVRICEAWARSQALAYAASKEDEMDPRLVERLWYWATREAKLGARLCKKEWPLALKPLTECAERYYRAFSAAREINAKTALLRRDHGEEGEETLDDLLDDTEALEREASDLPLPAFATAEGEGGSEGVFLRLLNAEADRYQERERAAHPKATSTLTPLPLPSDLCTAPLVPDARSPVEEALVLVALLSERVKWIAASPHLLTLEPSLLRDHQAALAEAKALVSKLL